MKALTYDRANQLVRLVATLMPFPAKTADLGGGWTPVQIDLGAFPNPDGTSVEDREHDRAGIDTDDMCEDHGMAQVWWFETWAGGTDRQVFSTLGPDAHPAEVAAWIAEQARAAGSPAAVAPPAPRPASPAPQDYFEKRIAEKVADQMVAAERALRAQFEHGSLKGRGHEVWSTGSPMTDPSDIFRANLRFVDAVNVRTRTLTPDGVPTYSPTQATITPRQDPAEPLLTVELYTPHVGPDNAPYVRTRHYKTGIGAARAIRKHLTHLVETGMHTAAGRPLHMVSSVPLKSGGTVSTWSARPTVEPKRMNAKVRDRDGDIWRRGRTRWTCTTPVDGERVRRVGRLHWSALVSMYGPVVVVDDGDRQEPTAGE